MRKDLADVTIVVDRSGSMAGCKIEAENGVNHFIEEQKSLKGECCFSLVQFDSDYEFVHKGVPIAEVGPYTLVPRGMTALLDAIGRAINETGDRLAKLPEDQRPGLVVFVITTDGQENSSHEFSKGQIREMIERQQNEYQWQFTFLGANQNAFAEAQNLGIQGAAANFVASNSAQAYKGASANVGRMRSAAFTGAVLKNEYTEEEKTAMKPGT